MIDEDPIRETLSGTSFFCLDDDDGDDNPNETMATLRVSSFSTVCVFSIHY